MTPLAICAPPPSIGDEASVALERWAIFEIPGGSRHFCGFHAGRAGSKGRVSSAIVRFDPDGMAGTTASGRVYRLVGEPDGDGDALVLRDAWLAVNGLSPAQAVEVEPGLAEMRLS